MLKLLVPLIIVLALAGGGFFLYKNLQTKSSSQPTSTPQAVQTPTSTTQPTSSPTTSTDPCEVLTKGSTDVPPLYSGINWGETMLSEEEILEYDESGNPLTTMLEGCLIKALNVDSDSTNKFDDAYYSIFERDKWKLVNDFGGPEGSTITHKKQNRYFLIDKHIDPKISSADNIRYNIKLFYSQ